MTTIAPPMPRAGPVEWLLATDHKRTALRTAGLAFVFFIASGVLAPCAIMQIPFTPRSGLPP